MCVQLEGERGKGVYCMKEGIVQLVQVLLHSIIECCALMCAQATLSEERERNEMELQRITAEHKAEKEVHVHLCVWGGGGVCVGVSVCLCLCV